MNKYHVDFETTPTPRAVWPPCSDLGKWLPGAFLYAVAGSILSLTGFITLVLLLAAGLGTLIIWIGIPLLIATLLAARGFAFAQGYLL